MKERVKVMKEHFRNVEQELEHTNALNSAKSAEIKTEGHMRQLASRALGKSKHDSERLQTEVESVQEQINAIQNLIYKANEGLDEFKMQMNWNQEELEQWAVAARQKEDDNMAMQKYTRADEIKIKEYTFQLEQLTKEALKCKERLDNEITDTQAKQMELDRIAADFKTARLLGVRSNRLISAAFGLSGVLAACVALILVIQNPQISPYYGLNITILSLVGIVIGGIASLRGAALGGFIVGVVLSALNTLLGNGRVYAYSWLFILVLVILLVRPGGLLSKGTELERV